jgi:hypothetical protein
VKKASTVSAALPRSLPIGEEATLPFEAERVMGEADIVTISAQRGAPAS